MSGGKRPLSGKNCPRSELYAENEGARSKSSESVKATVEALAKPLPRQEDNRGGESRKDTEKMCRWTNAQLFKDGESVQCVQGVSRLRRSNIQVQTTCNPCFDYKPTTFLACRQLCQLQDSRCGLPSLRNHRDFSQPVDIDHLSVFPDPPQGHGEVTSF